VTAPESANPTRLDELLIDEAVFGLPEQELAELEGMTAGEVDGLENPYLPAAATLDLATMRPGSEARMPAALRRRVEEDAARRLGSASRPAPSPSRDPGRGSSSGVIATIGWAPWLVAAASLLVATLAWLPIGGDPPETRVSPAEEMQTMIEQAGPELVRTSWQALDDPTVAGGVSGQVVWSDAEQRGFMKFQGLAVNDPTEQQYQLWIFDADRSEKHPVDGGVFDITDEGEVVVPITPKITVFDATAFAVTVERPGGVVVSDRSRLALLAPVEG